MVFFGALRVFCGEVGVGRLFGAGGSEGALGVDEGHARLNLEG